MTVSIDLTGDALDASAEPPSVANLTCQIQQSVPGGSLADNCSTAESSSVSVSVEATFPLVIAANITSVDQCRALGDDVRNYTCGERPGLGCNVELLECGLLTPQGQRRHLLTANGGGARSRLPVGTMHFKVKGASPPPQRRALAERLLSRGQRRLQLGVVLFLVTRALEEDEPVDATLDTDECLAFVNDQGNVQADVAATEPQEVTVLVLFLIPEEVLAPTDGGDGAAAQEEMNDATALSLQTFLPQSLGGLGVPDFRVLRFAQYAAVSYATWPSTVRAIPELALQDLTSDPSRLLPPAADFATTYSYALARHDQVVAAYAEVGSRTHYLANGLKRHHFHPSYPTQRTFPSLANLYADRTPGTSITTSSTSSGARQWCSSTRPSPTTSSTARCGVR